MHGLVNRAVESFVKDIYGQDAWQEVVRQAPLAQTGFEAMLIYDDSVTRRMLDAVARVLDRPLDVVLEDVGTYLVAHPSNEKIRRLLRFGGDSFPDFLYSLDDLPDRVWLAVPDLDFPRLELEDLDTGRYALRLSGGPVEAAHVLTGVLRALADDYGALVLIDQEDVASRSTVLTLRVADASFAEGRAFSLAEMHEPTA